MSSWLPDLVFLLISAHHRANQIEEVLDMIYGGCNRFGCDVTGSVDGGEWSGEDDDAGGGAGTRGGLGGS